MPGKRELRRRDRENRFCPEVIVVSRWPLRTLSGRSLSYQSFITGL